MALLDWCELLALLRVDETSKKEKNEKENMKCEKYDILKEGELQKEALKQASMLGDSALYRCNKKCARIEQLINGGILQKWKQ